MGGNNGVVYQRRVPSSDACRDLAIAFTARRRKIPFVALALRQDAGACFFDLRQRQTFPVAIGDFDQPIVDGVAEWLKPQRGADHFHGFARPLERTRHIIELFRPFAIAHKQRLEQSATFCGLPPPMRIEHCVTTALQASLNIEVGLAVSDVIEDRHTRFHGQQGSLSIRRNERTIILCGLQYQARPDASCRQCDNRRQHGEFRRSRRATCPRADRRPRHPPPRW